eukprot:TRINITY_DN41712_c0_g1_i1.p1 TRINITY_DN41712_c0_g1~~TRINITY_DN41712_c0_g1_i1.p1  ORF type:complete len:482 (+),score=39.91 TRINITY_DN41712_c0_g1_i1:150-1448(+)
MVQNVFGFSLGRGLNSALDTLVSQSNGAGEHVVSGIHLRRAQIVSIVVSVPCIIGLQYAEHFFLLVGINEHSARDAGQYVQGTLISLPVSFLYSATRSFLRAVKLPRPDFYVSVIVVLLHPIWCVVFLRQLQWGPFGAGLTMTCSNYVSFILLSGYVALVQPGPCRGSWRCLPRPYVNVDADSQEKAGTFRSYFRVAMPSALLMWSEWWVYEVMSLLAGLCGTEAIAAHTAVCNLLLILFMVPVALGSATAAIVGNAAGEGDGKTARTTIVVAVCFILCAFTVVGGLVLALRHQLARFFSSDVDVISTFVSLCSILAPFLIVDSVQTVLEGALRGLGLQRAASRAKLLSMLGIRLVGAYFLAIYLRVGVVGIWWGSLSGMVVTLALYLRILQVNDIDTICASIRSQLCRGCANDAIAELPPVQEQQETSVQA